VDKSSEMPCASHRRQTSSKGSWSPNLCGSRWRRLVDKSSEMPCASHRRQTSSKGSSMVTSRSSWRTASYSTLTWPDCRHHRSGQGIEDRRTKNHSASKYGG
jgi:hypothetical protein